MSRLGSDSRLAPPYPPWIALVAVLLGVAAMGLAARPALRFGLRPAIVLSELALVAPGLLTALLWTRGRTLRDALGDATPVRLGLAALFGAAAWSASLGLMGLQALVWEPPAGYLESFLQLHAALRPRGAVEALASLLAIAAAPALCEELLFRGLTLPAFARRLGPGAAILISALLFGLIHVDQATGGVSFYRVPFAILVGVALGAVRVLTGGLAAPVVAHLTLNAITFGSVVLLEPEVDPTAALGPGAAVSAALLAAGALVGVALLPRLRRN